MTYFNNKNILVTGAFGGFGQYFISRLLECGANLILSDVPQTVSAVLDGTRNMSTVYAGREKQILSVIPADLAVTDGCRTLYDECRKLNVRVDIIIHNAGIGFGGEFVDIPPGLNEKVISVNLLSIIRLNTLFLPEFIRRRSGHLIYMSSVAGFVATSLGVAYSTSKFGLRAFAMALHGEIKRRGIRTSIVYPFFSKTPMLKSQIFGNPKVAVMPSFCASMPDYVVTCTLKGAEKGKLHIFPGFFSKLMWLAVHFYPVISAQRKIQGYS